MADWVSGKVTKVEYWTDALFSLYVRAPVHPFTAGQFTKLGLEIDGERVQRAYSYVNAPGNPDLEFYLVTVPEGKLSPRLAALKPGDEVLVVSEAAGFFVLDEVPDCDTLWMLATGTALGPYLSILQEGKDLERFNNLVLVHAVRYAADLSYLPLMRELEQRYAGKLRIQTVVSRETVEGSLTGRVPFLIETGALEEAVGLAMNTDTSHVMLCGNPQMVRDTQQLYFYQQLDRLFPGIKAHYLAMGNSYVYPSPKAQRLMDVFQTACEENGIVYRMAEIIKQSQRDNTKTEQLSFF